MQPPTAGDGEYNASVASLSNGSYVPTATQGDGHVTTGPFANMTVHFREFALPLTDRYLPHDAWEYNPEGIDTPDYGTHAGGHYPIGSQMADFFASPADPVFWLHHGIIDRVWAD